jgi:site-specific DNA recombinase
LIARFSSGATIFIEKMTTTFPVAALRNHLQANGTEEQSAPDNERELIEHHVERVTLTPKHIKLQLRRIAEAPSEGSQDHVSDNPSGHPDPAVTTITIPWTSPLPAAVRGIIHVPAHNTPMKPSRREALLIAIAKARNWIDNLAHGRAASFAAIARREGKVERHVRLLAPLAFVSPRIVSALLNGTAPADLTLTMLARALPRQTVGLLRACGEWSSGCCTAENCDELAPSHVIDP